MYATADPDIVYQGDILLNFHFIVPSIEELKTLQVDSNNKFEVKAISTLPTPYASGKETVLANSFLANGIVITQTCDIQRRDYIHICPIHKISKLTQDLGTKGYAQSRIENVVNDLKKQKVNYYFHLPPIDMGTFQLEESYVDLQVITMLPRENCKFYKREATLSDKGRQWLSFKLINLYGRPF